MLSLLVATVCAAMMSTVMRLSEGRVRSRIAMLAVNYFTCTLLTGLTIGFAAAPASYAGMPRTLGMGLINGGFYVSALLAMQYNIPKNGVVLPAVFSKTGALMVPLVCSIFLFGEIPGAWQTVGAVLAVAGILLMNYSRGSTAGSKAALFLLLLMEGLSSSMSKVYREVGADALSDHFLLYTFISASVICILLIMARKERIARKEILFGALIGIPNFVGSRLVLIALKTLPAIIVYPFRSVGSIVLVTLIGLFLFREHLSKRQLAAMAVILTAMVMLNL